MQWNRYWGRGVNGHVTVRVEHSPVVDALPPGHRFCHYL